MAVTVTLILFSVFAMAVFLLAFAGVLHIVLMRVISYGIKMYFIERKIYLDKISREEEFNRLAQDSNIH